MPVTSSSSGVFQATRSPSDPTLRVIRNSSGGSRVRLISGLEMGDRSLKSRDVFLSSSIFFISASDTSFLELVRPFNIAVHRDSRLKSQVAVGGSFRASRIFWLDRVQVGTTFSTNTVRYLSFSWSLSHSV